MNKRFGPRTFTVAGRRKICVEPLEDRILLSVDLLPYAPEPDRNDDQAWERVLDDETRPGEAIASNAESDAARFESAHKR